MALLPANIPTINFFGQPVERIYYLDSETGRATVYLDDFAGRMPESPEELVRATSYGIGVVLADAHAREATELVLRLREPEGPVFLPLDCGLGIAVALGIDPGTHFEGLAALPTVRGLDMTRINFGASQLPVHWDAVHVDTPKEATAIQQEYCSRVGAELCPDLAGLPTIFWQVKL
ncbi:MAG: hypothetical protein Q3962_06275 [Corynebacterium sp.]|nr:hypothetical protein [Corynebacterium sp.]